MVADLQDPRRVEPDHLLSERAMLEGWLEFHRTTLLIKCEGLDDAQRKARPVPTSALSLHGLVRHMAEVERGWFRRVLLDRARRPAPLVRPTPSRTGSWCPLDDADWEADLATGRPSARRPAGPRPRGRWTTPAPYGTVRPCSLRWIYQHMIEEYARHNGHADLLRELVDGAVGW